jgi:ATP/maltotriose-dependent transcriptional regulator MalT
MFQESGQCQEWLNSDCGALWIKATAGAGKSVVAAHVASLLTAKENVPVLSFFFFRQIIATNRTPQALIRDWLAQLLKFSPPLQKKLKELLNQRRSLETLSLDQLWEIALSAMASCSRTYCVVDALDEMDSGNEDFMRKLVRLVQENSSSIKLLVTSRPLPHIE